MAAGNGTLERPGTEAPKTVDGATLWERFDGMRQMIKQQQANVDNAKALLAEEERKLSRLVDEKAALRQRLQAILTEGA